jgi:hypothetical protein
MTRKMRRKTTRHRRASFDPGGKYRAELRARKITHARFVNLGWIVPISKKRREPRCLRRRDGLMYRVRKMKAGIQ